jgi:ATP-dependent DNA helicase 2 subunit 2
LLRGLAEDCDGVYGTLAQAIAELDTPRVKVVRGIPSFRGDVRLGDPTQYDTALRIQVERYYRTYVAKPPSASSFVMKTGGDVSQPSTQTLDASKDVDANLTSVRNVRTYHVDDPQVAGGKRELDRDELAKGYEYGRTAVHISESDENITKLETTAVMDLIGFIQADHVCFPIPRLLDTN